MILIGIFENGEGKIGLIYDVMYDELYYVFSGRGVYMNEMKLVFLKEIIIEEVIFVINVIWVMENRRIDLSVLVFFVKRVRGICFYGFVVLELVNVVVGRIDVYIMM